MPRITQPSSERRPSALEVFTDREGFISAFNDLLEHKDPSDNDVLVFYGEGGIGKSTLSWKLEEGLGKGRPRARLDFAAPGNTEPDYALFRLKEAFPRFAFPTFSIAVAAYAKRVHPDATFLASRGSFLEGAGPFTDVLEVALDAPVVGLTLKALKAGLHGIRVAEVWYKKRAEPLLVGLGSMQPEEILERLPALWARDLRDALIQQGGATGYDDEALPMGPAPVVFLDTFEALWRAGLGRKGALQRLREGWLVDLVGRLPEVLWVVSGRDRLSWPDVYDAQWEACLKQHLVGRLSDEDAAAFLAKRQVTDAALVEVMVRSASGLPFYLELETQLYDRTPVAQRRPSAFGGSHAEVIERLLGYLDASEQETMRLLSAFGSWDAALFAAVVGEFGTGYPAGGAERFGGFWSIERLAADRWQMHQELVDHLQRDEAASRPERHREVHAFGFACYDARLEGKSVRDVTVDDVEALGGALRHAWVVQEPGEISDWFWARAKVLASAALWRPLLMVEEDYLGRAEAAYGPDHPSVAATLNNLAGLLETLSRYEEAEPLYRRSLAISEAAYGPDHPSVAVTLNNLAGLLDAMGRHDEAEELRKRL
jgi:tetratricopeptide (TPR) repeat protein